MHPRDNPLDRFGLDMRQNWLEVIEIPPSGGLDEFDRKRTRNDYPLMALLEMGVGTEDGEELSRDLLDPYFELLVELLREEPPYTFGEDAEIYEKLFELGMANWSKASDITFPEDLVFIDRSLGGHFGNLARLGATGPWRQLVGRYSEAALSPSTRGRSRNGHPESGA